MENDKEILRAIETAMAIVPGRCSCGGVSDGTDESDVLCDHCFVSDVLNRCHYYVKARMHTLSYSEEVNSASIYPGKDMGIMGLLYAVLGLVGEAGEVANAVKKELRDNQKVVDYLNRMTWGSSLNELGVDVDTIIEECGDVLFYTYRTAKESGVEDIRQIMGQNIHKIREKRQKILNARKERDNAKSKE
jgi:NTP pyrophosphatase (non-canonical NTP hydrolase)